MDLFLCALMRDHPGLRARLEDAGINPEQVAAAKRRAEAAGVLRGFGISKNVIVELFGLPAEDGQRSMFYRLTLWPQHRYRWSVGADGNVFYDTFVLDPTAINLPEQLPLDPKIVQDALRIGFHTILDAERVLGPAVKTEGWGAMEDWTYRSRSGNDFVLQFDFGLLTGLRIGEA